MHHTQFVLCRTLFVIEITPVIVNSVAIHNVIGATVKHYNHKINV